MNSAHAINKKHYKKALNFYTALIEKIMTPHITSKNSAGLSTLWFNLGHDRSPFQVF